MPVFLRAICCLLIFGTATAQSAQFFDAFSYGASESAGVARVNIERAVSLAPASVHFVTSDGTAKAGVDYEARSGVVEFGPGETSKQIEIPIIDNGVLQAGSTRSFLVTLSEPQGAEITGNNPVIVVISDNEIPAGIDFSYAPDIDLGYPTKAVMQPDGKLLIVLLDHEESINLTSPSCQQYRLIRLNVDGSRDLTFRQELSGELKFCGQNYFIPELMLLADGSIVVNGTSYDNEFNPFSQSQISA